MSVKRPRSKHIPTLDEIILQVTNPTEFKKRKIDRRLQLAAIKSQKKATKKSDSSSLWCVSGGLPTVGKR